ncbi:MAG: hypothetical protein RJA22_1591 [Verrucomicrobiota bacterium]|jgi:1,4-alpha-glucan branching enzyme
MTAKAASPSTPTSRTRGGRARPVAAATPRPSVRVHLEYRDPRASEVYIAGSFNDWHPSVTEMLEVSPGHWVKELMLPAGLHEYRLVVDGEWKPDPACPGRAPNPFGGENSLLRVDA